MLLYILATVALVLWSIFLMYGALYLWDKIIKPTGPDDEWWALPTSAIMWLAILITVVADIISFAVWIDFLIH